MKDEKMDKLFERQAKILEEIEYISKYMGQRNRPHFPGFIEELPQEEEEKRLEELAKEYEKIAEEIFKRVKERTKDFYND